MAVFVQNVNNIEELGISFVSPFSIEQVTY